MVHIYDISSWLCTVRKLVRLVDELLELVGGLPEEGSQAYPVNFLRNMILPKNFIFAKYQMIIMHFSRPSLCDILPVSVQFQPDGSQLVGRASVNGFVVASFLAASPQRIHSVLLATLATSSFSDLSDLGSLGLSSARILFMAFGCFC